MTPSLHHTSQTPDQALRPCGAFDAAGVAALRPSIEALAATSAPRVVLDLSDVASMDGSGLGAITYMFKRLVARGPWPGIGRDRRVRPAARNADRAWPDPHPWPRSRQADPPPHLVRRMVAGLYKRARW